MSVKITIDRDECILCGACWAECPMSSRRTPTMGLSQLLEDFQVDGDPAIGRGAR